MITNISNIYLLIKTINAILLETGTTMLIPKKNAQFVMGFYSAQIDHLPNNTLNIKHSTGNIGMGF